MGKRPRNPLKANKAKRPRDLSAGPKAASVKAGIKLKPCFITSYSTSG